MPMIETITPAPVWIENDSDYRDIRSDIFIDRTVEDGSNDLFLRFSFPNAGKGLGFGLTPYVALVHGDTVLGEIPLDAVTVGRIGGLLTQAAELFTPPLDKYGAPVCSGRTEDPEAPGERAIYITDENGADTEDVLATVAPADTAVARYVLGQPVNPQGKVGEGRSPMYWVRLQNGDLMLGCFPQAEAYEATETDPRRP